MRVQVTAKIKIPSTPGILNTFSIYQKAMQFCIDTAWQHKIKNKFRLQHLVYKDIRSLGLHSQLAIACIRDACGIVKKAKSKPIISRVSIGYNFPRSARYVDNTLRIAGVGDKRLHIKINVPKCYAAYFADWQMKESKLFIDKKKRCFFCFTFSKEINVRDLNSQSQILGIDLGVNNLAVTSDGQFFHSSKVKQAKRRFKHLRSILQAKGTRPAKRLLMKISGREQRFMAWVNHNISKSIVANFVGNKIVMENLKGIRKQRRGKRMNYWISNWSFFQLQSFIAYKAAKFGIATIKVKPAYTSQICHRCGKLGTRSFGCFKCSHCGLSSYSADLNAARNLCHPMLGDRQAAVTQPYSRSVDAKGILTNPIEAELMAKSPCL